MIVEAPRSADLGKMTRKVGDYIGSGSVETPGGAVLDLKYKQPLFGRGKLFVVIQDPGNNRGLQEAMENGRVTTPRVAVLVDTSGNVKVPHLRVRDGFLALGSDAEELARPASPEYHVIASLVLKELLELADKWKNF